MIILNKPFDSEVLLMKIKAIMQRKATDTVADSKQFEFNIGGFDLNSKLRFLNIMVVIQKNYLQKRMNFYVY